jgi:hypothetical protein
MVGIKLPLDLEILLLNIVEHFQGERLLMLQFFIVHFVCLFLFIQINFIIQIFSIRIDPEFEFIV